ncbi:MULTISPECIES: helix-turn-helix domain-containing protein [Alphaproteobacteria]
MNLAYRYRLLPTRAQHGRLRAALEHSRQLYNAGATHA